MLSVAVIFISMFLCLCILACQSNTILARTTDHKGSKDLSAK